ncbi:hypothetical protein FACS1894180_8720 [Bacteroidia bacterium]|nr:hypothetical protein FACS1894180_8720 [Bacteroidia bacterium]
MADKQISLKSLLYGAIAFITVAFCSFLLGRCSGSKQKAEGTVTVSERIIIEHDTIRDTVPQLVYRVQIRTVVDTLLSIDSVEVPVFVPIEQAQYANTVIQNNDTVKYKAYISGYRSSLDSIYFDISKQTIERTITINPKAKKWGLGIQLGGGAGYYDKKVIVSPYIGIGISYNFWRW